MKRADKQVGKTWIYTGTGSVSIAGVGPIKPNVPFVALEKQIPTAFRDVIRLQKEVKESEKTEEAQWQEPRMVRRPGAKYEVFGWDGKVVSERLMTKEDAEKLLKLVKKDKPAEL